MDRTKMKAIEKKADEELRSLVKQGKARCNCGGPQYGTDHSPDCSLLLLWDEIKADLKSEVAED